MIGGGFAAIREVDGWSILAQKDLEQGEVVLRFTVWVSGDKVQSCGVLMGGIPEEAVDRVIADLAGDDEHGGWKMARRALEEAVDIALENAENG